jgi:hypothetical protein
MLLSLHPTVGTIRLEPALLDDSGPTDCDDSSLELLLSSFAHHTTLNESRHEACDSVRIVAARRLNWLPACATEVAVRANLAQLVDDLEAALQELSGAGA